MRTRLPAAAAALVAAAALAAADPPALPIPARLVKMDMAHSTLGKVAPALAKAADIPVAFPDAAATQPCEAPFAGGRPFWDALELVADQTGNRITLRDGGRKVGLAPRGKSREVSSVRGPFRVVAERVTARYLLDDGVAVYDVHLKTHWEPRVPVFRIDTEPAVTAAADDRGVALTGSGGRAKSHPAGEAAHAATVRLAGLTRESRKIATLDGHFTVAASTRMLAFRFPDLAAKAPPPLPPQEGVTAVLKRFAKEENTWEAELELTYPPDLPVFESFESWTTENRARLTSPDGKSFAPAGHATSAVGSKVSATYYFKEEPAKGLANPAAKGWGLVYDAPTPPVEFAVPFELKDIPLP